jgi:hypothetical protein
MNTKICFSYLLICFFLFSFVKMDTPKNKGMANVVVLKAYSQNVLGKNVGYYVEFKNNATVQVDGLKWTALFYDNFDELKGKNDGEWSSGNFIKPIKVGGTTKDIESAWIKNATKVFIIINKVHFENGK